MFWIMASNLHMFRYTVDVFILKTCINRRRCDHVERPQDLDKLFGNWEGKIVLQRMLFILYR